MQYFEGACTLAEVAELKELGAPFFDRVLELTSRAIMKLFDQRLATSKKLESHMGNIAAIRSSIIPFVSDVLKEEPALARTNACPACLDRDADRCCVPCGHMVCEACVPMLNNKCMVCRSNIDKTVKIYYA